ncbi:hypothetical protein CDD83_6063 [Cordyceps sp. RAO-2017]|nr:hypothetical protein CDD83_6063 [Cordyceps sp. RAO-2017]
MKLSLLASTAFVAAALAGPMRELVRHRVSYRYNDPESYQLHDSEVNQIVRDDTGATAWICALSLPPICFPPALTEEAIAKLKGLNGVVINDIEEHQAQ